MTARNSVDVPFFFISGYEFRGALTEFDHTVEALVEETHGLGDSWVESQYVGVRSTMISQKGFYDDGVNSVHEALSTGLATAKVLSYGLEGTATGAAFMGMAGAIEVKYKRAVSRGQLHKAEAEYRNGPGSIVEQGKIVQTYKSATSSGTTSGTPLDLGTTASSSGAGYLQVNSCLVNTASAAGHALVKIQDSSDNLTFADLATFTTCGSGNTPRGERVSISTGIERYIIRKLDFVAATTITTAQIDFFVGIVRY